MLCLECRQLASQIGTLIRYLVRASLLSSLHLRSSRDLAGISGLGRPSAQVAVTAHRGVTAHG